MFTDDLDYKYNFPPTKFFVGDDNSSRRRQSVKIMEECAECFSAIEHDSNDVAIEECFDIVVACETLLRSYDPDVVHECYRRGLQKNDDRDYWLWNPDTGHCSDRDGDW